MIKKKSPKLRTATKPKDKASLPTKKYSSLKFIFFFVIALLLLVTFYRKEVIHFLFDGEMTSISLFTPAYAQSELPAIKKKALLEDQVELNGVRFAPEVGLNGFRVISQIDLPSFECELLKQETYRLGFLLFPTDRFNEKFLIKIRQCSTSGESEALSRWLKSIDQQPDLTKKELTNRSLLTDVLNSPYNLITDQTLKSKLTDILIDMPEETLSEVLLKSWLFLMLGNITRSDNLLKNFINTPPYNNWKKNVVSVSFYHTLGAEFIDGILEKLARHPSDRLVFRLFCEYILSYYSDSTLLSKISKNHTSLSKDFIGLEYVKRIAPPFVNHLRLKNMSETERLIALKNVNVISYDEQSLWHWPFFNIDPLVSETLYPTLAHWEKNDQLWFIYLMQSEKLIDVWSKKSGKSFIHGRRQFLRSQLEGKDFMMALYKLIQLGDIDQSLVQLVQKHQAE